MVMSWIFTLMLGVSFLAALLTGNGSALAEASVSGARSGITLGITMAGSLCLWSGIGRLMEENGMMNALSSLLSPVLCRLFPSSKSDPVLCGHLSGNICANLLGLGNAATPMGIQAAKRLAAHSGNGVATDELCRLVVLNTASIQLIPASVAAIRLAQGCKTPYDILPAVWVTSFCSAAAGVAAAWLMGKAAKHG